MKANELRIGNLVQFWGDKECPSKVMGFCNSRVYLHLDDNKYINPELVDCSPILLTEEWLLKFGFEGSLEYFSDTQEWKLQNSPYWIYNPLTPNNYLLYHDDNALTIIKYVHQLQNLYFALTNEELKIN